MTYRQKLSVFPRRKEPAPPHTQDDWGHPIDSIRRLTDLNGDDAGWCCTACGKTEISRHRVTLEPLRVFGPRRDALT